MHDHTEKHDYETGADEADTTLSTDRDEREERPSWKRFTEDMVVFFLN